MRLNDDEFRRQRKEVAGKMAGFGLALPDLGEAELAVREATRDRRSVRDVLWAGGRLLVQPRCGVSDHYWMLHLHSLLAHADIGTLTVDSYTRLLQLDKADGVGLNGYPLITRGAGCGRELVAAAANPLQVRHGSPDGRPLAEVTFASGITAFEGGGISYNLPYSAEVPLAYTLRAYQYVDRLAGRLTERTGVRIDRETFGTLTGVMVPPVIGITVSILEALLAAEQGVRCVTLSVCETGYLPQDVAALRVMTELCGDYLRELYPACEVEVYTSFHQWMGVFPADPVVAREVIAFGVMAAVAGGATKLISKTVQEAIGVPTPETNAKDVLYCQQLAAFLHDRPELVTVLAETAEVADETERLRREVRELLAPVLGTGTDLIRAVVDSFATGRLDIPFPASRYARGDVIPARDHRGAIRILQPGNLSFGSETLARHAADVGTTFRYRGVMNDLFHVSAGRSLNDDARRTILNLFHSRGV